MSGRTERALQCERRRPARRGPCWKTRLIHQPVHLKGSGSRPEGRGKGKLPSHHSHWSKREESAGDQTPAPRPPGRSRPERAAAPAHTAAAGPGSVARSRLPATVGGRRGKGEGSNDREEGGARPPGRRLLSRKSRNSFPAKETPRDAPARSAAFPQLIDSPAAAGLSSAHPGAPRAHELVPDALPRLSEGPRPGSAAGSSRNRRIPRAPATAGSGDWRMGSAQRGAKCPADVDLKGRALATWAAAGRRGRLGAAESGESCRVAQTSLRSARVRGDRSRYLQESRCLRLARLCATPPDRAAGIRPRRAAPRPPPQRPGEPGGPPASVRLSVPPGRSARHSGAAGGARRGGALGCRPAGLSSSRHLASARSQGSPGQRARRSATGGRWLPGFGGATGGRMAGQSEATLRGARPGPAPSAESPLEPRAPSGGELERAPRLPPARPPWPRAPRPLGRQTYSAAPAARATASQKSRGPGDTANLPGIFLGTREAPTCFKTKCEGRNNPTSCLFTTSLAA